jgi:hypothetical protein
MKIVVSVKNCKGKTVCESVILVWKMDNKELLKSVIWLGDAPGMPVVWDKAEDDGKMIGLGSHNHNGKDVIYKSHSIMEDPSLAGSASKQFRDEL